MACCILMAYIVTNIVLFFGKVRSWFSFRKNENAETERNVPSPKRHRMASFIALLGFLAASMYTYQHRGHLRAELAGFGILKADSPKEAAYCSPTKNSDIK